MDKLKFHRDKMGIYVYYAGVNQGLGHNDYVLNRDIKFNVKENSVVPEPESISTLTTEEKTVGYISLVSKDNCKISVDDYEARKLKLVNEKSVATQASDVDGEVRAEVSLRQLRESWQPDRQMVKTLTKHEFEIIDIEYPADDRLVPIRHYDDKMVGYFKVDGKFVVDKLAKDLCDNAGLVSDGTGSTRGKYCASKTSYYGWKLTIEGDEFGKPVNDGGAVKDFTGTMVECHEFIRSAEKLVRSCFDQWVASRKYPDKFTVGEMLKHLDSIEFWVRSIDFKVKSKSNHGYATSAIARAREEIINAAKEAGISDDTEVSGSAQ
tara:strand:+ start:155715 stop:156680 length:966 start_codon:yes stop_codon:yes gene_type:complete